MKQVRLPLSEVGLVMQSVSAGLSTWDDQLTKYPAQEAPKEE